MSTLALSGLCRRALAFALSLALTAILVAAEAKLTFDVPAGEARDTLKRFALQAKREIVFPPFGAIQTNAVKGELTVREALDRLLAGTPLAAFEDGKTGGLVVRREDRPKAQRAAQATRSDRPTPPVTTDSTETRQIGGHDEVFELSPFTVSVGQDKGYRATSTMSGTRLNSNLEDLAAAITVLNKQQMLDMAAVDINDLFLNESSTEGTFQFNASEADRNGNVADAGLNPDGANRIRGLGAANLAMNSFARSIPADTYNLDAVEISRGPNSNIFGLGNASGTLNMVPSQANATRAITNLTLRADDSGGARASFDVNRPIVRDRLALRLLGVYDEKGFERKPAVDRTKRLTLAVTARPFRSTKVQASYERYSNFNRRANTVTPRDFITPWKEAGSPTWDPTTWTAHVGGRSIVITTTNETLLPVGLTGNAAGMYARPSIYVDDGRAELMMVNRSAIVPPSPATTPASPFNNTSNARIVQIGSTMPPLYIPLGLTDRSQYDWAEVNTLQPNSAASDATIYSVLLEHFFLNTKTHLLGLQAGFYREDMRGTNRNFIGTGQGVPTNLLVDVNEKLLDGSPNPYFLRPYFGGTDIRVSVSSTRNDNYRTTLAYQADLTQQSGWVRWLGRHRFTGYGEYRKSEGGAPAYREYVFWTPPGSTTPTYGPVPGWRYYVGGAGKYVEHAPRSPVTFLGSQNLSWYNYGTTRWQTDPVDVRDIYYAGTRSRREIDTGGIVWQGFLLRERLVPMIGIRRDRNRSRSSDSVLNPLTQVPDISPLYSFPGSWITAAGATKTKGLVLKATRWLHFHYNQADSFTPAVAAVNIFGAAVPYPTGTGKDYGLTLNLSGGKLIARINAYETLQLNSRDSNVNVISQRAQRLDFSIPTQSFANSLQARATGWVRQLHPEWSAQQQADEVTRVIGLPPEFVAMMRDAPSVSDTNAAKSTGLELELNYNPSPNLTFKATGTRQKAINSAIGPTTAIYTEQRMPYWKSVVDPSTGLYWWTQSSNPNVAASGDANIPVNWYLAQVLAPYKLAIATQGKSRPQVREWRFNAMSTYRFAGVTSNKYLKNVSVGGAVRWEDRGSIGYLAGATDSDGVMRTLDPSKPVYDRSRFYADVMASYHLRLLGERVRARVQLNVRNVLESGRLQPIAVNPDGQVSIYRIVDPRQFVLTTSFDL